MCMPVTLTYHLYVCACLCVSVPDMTYRPNVFGGTLSLTQSINQSVCVFYVCMLFYFD